MPTNLIKKDVITALAARAAGLDNREGNPRLKQVVNRLLIDLMIAIDDLDISMNEFWGGVAYLTQSGQAQRVRIGRAGRRARAFPRPGHRRG